MGLSSGRILSLQVNDWIIWQGKSHEDAIPLPPGTVGKVLKVSENRLAQEARELGLPITAGPWALVEFENGFQIVIVDRYEFERVGRSSVRVSFQAK